MLSFPTHSFLLNIIKDIIEICKMNIVLFQPLSAHVQPLSQAQWGIPSQKHSWSFPSLSNAVLYTHHLGIYCNPQHFVLNYTVKTNLFSHRLVFYFFFQFSMSLPCTHNLNDVWCLKLQQFLGGIFFSFFCMEMLQSVSMFTWWWLLRFFHHPHCWLLTNTGWTLCTRIWKHIGFCFPWTISRRMVGL